MMITFVFTNNPFDKFDKKRYSFDAPAATTIRNVYNFIKIIAFRKYRIGTCVQKAYTENVNFIDS